MRWRRAVFPRSPSACSAVWSAATPGGPALRAALPRCAARPRSGSPAHSGDQTAEVPRERWPAPPAGSPPPEQTKRLPVPANQGGGLHDAERVSPGKDPRKQHRIIAQYGGGRGVESLRSGGGPGSSAGSSSRCHPPLPSSPRRTTASTHPGPMRPSPQWASASSGRRSRRYSGTPIVSDSSRRCLGSPSTTTAAAARTR